MSVFAKEIKAWLSAYTEAQKPPMDETKLKHLCAAIHHFNQIPKERLERLITIIKIRTRGNYSLSDQDSLKLELIIKALKKEELDIDAADIILISHLYVMVDDRFGASNKLSENEIFIDLVENALDFAIQHKLTESVNIILTNQFLNALFIDSEHSNIFHAVQAQHFPTAKALLLKKADPNVALTQCGTTPLHRATIDNQLEIAGLLIQFNANVDTETKEGWTALHFAAEHGYIALVKLLLDSKASGKKNSQNGSNVLNMAVGNHRISIVKLLLERGFSVHDLNNKGYSYLHIAAENGLVDITQLLLQHGANPDLVCNNKLAINFASNPQVRALLQEATMSKKPILNQFPISVANAPNTGTPSSVTMTSTNNSKQNI